MAFKIFLDAGHNDKGWDTGASGFGLCEQDVTYSVAKKIKEVLAMYDVEIKLSRPNKNDNLGSDLNSSLRARATMANAWGADLFVSIHCNSVASTRAFGTEVYTISKESPTNRLALAIGSAISTKLGTHNRGLKHANFAVLKNTKMPAMLIELAFISNVNDNEKLKNNQDEFARAIASQLIGEYNLEVCEAKKEITSANDIIWELMNGKHNVEILDVQRAVEQLEEAKKQESSLYWILRKLVNG